MRIAILTLPLDTNIGGILQCYALQTVLERMGHDVQVLAKPQYARSFYWIYPLSVGKRFLQHLLLGKQVPIWKTPHEIVSQHVHRFIQQRIHRRTRRCWSEDVIRGFDAIVVGSDQIWRPDYLWIYSLEDVFLQFTHSLHLRRIAYAASFGVDKCPFTPAQLQKCIPLLKKFDAVSVRESSGVEICRNDFGVEACQMMDPTLLLQTEDYSRLVEQGDTKPSAGDLLVYLLDRNPDKEAIVNAVATTRNGHPFHVGSRVDDAAVPLKERIQIPVEQWLRGFKEAKMVVTDSFHGCVFSILFQKPFVAIGNASRGMARFTSLLQLFGLEDRLIGSLAEFQLRKEELLTPIDYVSVYARLRICREKAMTFLNQNLDGSPLVMEN